MYKIELSQWRRPQLFASNFVVTSLDNCYKHRYRYSI